MKFRQLIIIGLFFIFPNFTLANETISPIVTVIDENKQIISGLISEGAEVLVYIDGRFSGVAQVNISGTPTDNFYFSYADLLNEGEHSVVVYARDRERLLLSESSEEKKFSVKKIEEKKPMISKEAGLEKNNQASVDLINSTSPEDLSTTSLEIPNEKNKRILIWNLSVFIFFLGAVIGWIIWVNKELKKEKEEQEKEIKK